MALLASKIANISFCSKFRASKNANMAFFELCKPKNKFHVKSEWYKDSEIAKL